MKKQALLSFVTESINERVPLVAGIGGNNTQEIINCIRELDLAGVDGILSVAPIIISRVRGVYYTL
jgi:4-hydroxy-tetrahydrodipicolinate synthase